MTDRNELNDLYQEVILEHSKAPRNFRRPDTTNHTAEGYNPLCGDHYTLFLDLDGDTVRDIGFQGAGCAISKASASPSTAITSKAWRSICATKDAASSRSAMPR